MLQFIFGKPLSGKTYTIINKIKELNEQNKTCVLIVPEQFTFETEREVLKRLGDKAALNVTVVSFTRLLEEIGRTSGGLASVVLGESDKVIFMKRALNESKSNLKIWSKYSHSASFAKSLLDTIGEFKINAISASQLKKTAEECTSVRLKTKLLDIATVYEAYDTLLGEKFLDPADMLKKIYDMLKNSNYFKNKTVFFDSFKGFTGQQFKIIDQIFSQADDVYISLTNNAEKWREFDVFTNIRITSQKIENLAKRRNITVLPPIILSNSRYNNIALSNLEKIISGKTIDNNENGIINICKASTIFDEADFVARTIRKLVRTKGYRYRDFVVIARDSETYKESISTAFLKNNVALFFDNLTPLSAFPLAKTGKYAVEGLDYSTENILRFHKSGLGTLSTEEISILENYTYLWNINGKVWLENWSADPRGFVTDDFDEKNAELLEKINILRQKAIEPFIRFKNKFKGTAKDMASALIDLFDFCDSANKLTALAEQQENLSADFLKLSFEEYMKILDSLVVCFGESTISKKEFFEALEMSVSLAEIGVIPQTLDQVSFGSADRIRTSQPKVAFIIGANQGVFPMITANSGILSIAERNNLINIGLNIADNSIYSSIDEEFLVYRNLCCASDEIYISYAMQSLSGEGLEPSNFVETIRKNLKTKEFSEPKNILDNDNLPETESGLFSEYCRRLNDDDTTAITLNSLLKNSKLKEKVSFLDNLSVNKDFSISPNTAKTLYGEKIRMSASRFDTFNRCHFSYFCRYGLNTKKLQPADFDVMQKGTVVHFVLERFITEQKVSLDTLTDETIGILTEKYINEYLDSVTGYRNLETANLKFIVSRISRSLKDVIRHIVKELSQSKFKPIACELKIGIGSDFGELEFPFDNGTVSLTGSIDRVDEYNGYIRVIDYKTGSKSFKLPDILFGLNLQMLIYLYALTRARSVDDKKAAAILYQPSKRDTNDSGMAMNGLLQSDIDIIKAMDKNGQGEFVPKLQINKDGTLSKRSASFVETEKFSKIFDYIEKLMQKTGNTLLSGDISVSPVDGRESPACKYCDYSAICGIDDEKIQKVPDLKNDEVFELMEEAENNVI